MGVSLANSIQISWPLNEPKSFRPNAQHLYRPKEIDGSCFFHLQQLQVQCWVPNYFLGPQPLVH